MNAALSFQTILANPSQGASRLMSTSVRDGSDSGSSSLLSVDSYGPIMISDDCLLSHIDALYRYGMVLSCNAAVASDLVQETYVRALNFRKKLHGDNNIKGWMFTILRNIWLNQLQKERSSPGLTERDCAEVMELAAGLQYDPHQQLMRKVEAERVREAIRQLPDNFREVILLREYEDLSYREIAELVGCPVGTVMSRLARARAQLRKLLKDFRMEKWACGSLDARRQRATSNPPLKCLSRVPSYGEMFDAILPDDTVWFVMGSR